MSYYYSGNVRKQFTSNRQLKIIAQQKAQRLENIKNIMLVICLIGCFIGAAYLDGQSLAEGLIH